VIDATVAIVTRNRGAELRSALSSATSQHGAVEVLVLDDASDDRETEDVAREFPEVRFVRFEERAGLVVRRNDAARLASGPVIVSIDDGAVFSSDDCLLQTLRDFDHPAIGPVAIPYDDIAVGSTAFRQRAPEGGGIWVAPTFSGGACAVRRDVFLALGGFREQIVHQGEEVDFCLRLLSAGYVVRLGRGSPIHHRPSPTRDLDRMDTYRRRNELLFSFTYFPLPLALAVMAGYAVRGMVHGFRVRRPYAMLHGIMAGVEVCLRLRRERRPVGWRLAMLHLRLRRAHALRLEALAPRLPLDHGSDGTAQASCG
jgi:GT2 family glycosyltransferase